MEIKIESFQIEKILKDLGFQQIKKQGGSRPGYTALCRFHNDKNPSFSIGDNGLWLCWSCSEKGNLKTLITRLGGTMDWRDVLRMAGASLSKFEPRPRVKKIMAELPPDFVEYSFQAEVHSYVAGRLKWETIKAFRLGECSKWPNSDRVIIPILHGGKCVGYHGRALKADAKLKYYNPSSFEIKDYLFNYDGCDKGAEIIAVEGAFNAMSMVEKGFKNTVATFGTKFKPEQVQKIFSLRPTSVVVCFDRDSKPSHPGQKAALRLAEMLDALVRVEIMPLPFDKDPNNLDASVLRKCYEKRVPYAEIIGG